MVDPFVIVDLLFQGPRGWIVLGFGFAASAWLGWKKYLRLEHIPVPRRSTVAYMGGGGKPDAMKPAEVADLLLRFQAFDAELWQVNAAMNAGRAGALDAADRILRVADAMDAECQRLDRLNIQFPRTRDHTAFFAKVDAERVRAQRYRALALAAMQGRVGQARRSAQ
jgi:hypothetical protein